MTNIYCFLYKKIHVKNTSLPDPTRPTWSAMSYMFYLVPHSTCHSLTVSLFREWDRIESRNNGNHTNLERETYKTKENTKNTHTHKSLSKKWFQSHPPLSSSIETLASSSSSPPPLPDQTLAILPSSQSDPPLPPLPPPPASKSSRRNRASSAPSCTLRLRSRLSSPRRESS